MVGMGQGGRVGDVDNHIWRKPEMFVSDCIMFGKNLGHFVLEDYYASPIADIRYVQMPEVQLAAGR